MTTNIYTKTVNSPSLQPTLSLLETIRIDICRYECGAMGAWRTLLKNLYTHPSLLSVVYYRIGKRLWVSRRSFFVPVLLLFYRMLYPVIRMYGGVELSIHADIGPGLCILHFGPTVIHPDVVAGANLTLLHRVTIGASKSGVPQLGDNVSVGIGATIIGGVKIGDNVNIGAGAVVTRDLPSNCTAVGIPAQPINQE